MNDFYGLPVGILENKFIRLEYLSTAGPRIVRFALQGRPNLLAELPEAAHATPHGTYHFRGGHRLWCAPESLPGSYAPDDDGLQVEGLPGGLRLSGQPEPASGIVKKIEIRLAPDRAALTLRHELWNTGLRPVEVSRWWRRPFGSCPWSRIPR